MKHMAAAQNVRSGSRAKSHRRSRPQNVGAPDRFSRPDHRGTIHTHFLSHSHMCMGQNETIRGLQVLVLGSIYQGPVLGAPFWQSHLQNMKPSPCPKVFSHFLRSRSLNTFWVSTILTPSKQLGSFFWRVHPKSEVSFCGAWGQGIGPTDSHGPQEGSTRTSTAVVQAGARALARNFHGGLGLVL